MFYYIVEIPSNAATIFAGRVVDVGTRDQMENRCRVLAGNADADVYLRQCVANARAGSGSAATEVSAFDYTVIPCNDWDGEFSRRRKLR